MCGRPQVALRSGRLWTFPFQGGPAKPRYIGPPASTRRVWRDGAPYTFARPVSTLTKLDGVQNRHLLVLPSRGLTEHPSQWRLPLVGVLKPPHLPSTCSVRNAT